MTVEFDENNKLRWYLIDKEQAQKFIDFLDREIGRHKLEMTNCQIEMYKYGSQLKDDFSALLYESAVNRHKEDIESAEHLIYEVRHFFKLDNITATNLEEATNG